jgi:hypothetical protein
MYIRRGIVGASGPLCGDFLSSTSECWASERRVASSRRDHPLIEDIPLDPGESLTVFVAGRIIGNTVSLEVTGMAGE